MEGLRRTMVLVRLQSSCGKVVLVVVVVGRVEGGVVFVEMSGLGGDDACCAGVSLTAEPGCSVGVGSGVCGTLMMGGFCFSAGI